MTLKRFQTNVELNLAFAGFGVECKRDSLKLRAATEIPFAAGCEGFCQKLTI